MGIQRGVDWSNAEANPSISESSTTNGQSAALSSEEERSESGDNRKKKRRYTKIIGTVASVLLIVSVLIVAFFSQNAAMPKMIGVSLQDAQERLRLISDKWTIEYVNEQGETIEYEKIEAPYKYEVASIEPASGTLLSKSSQENVIVVLTKTDNQIKREQVLQETLTYYKECGWVEPDIFESEYFVVIKGHNDVSLLDLAAEGQTDGPSRLNQGSKTEWDKYAKEMNTDLLVAGYTRDGWLFFAYEALCETIPEEAKGSSRKKMIELESAGKQFVRHNAQTYIKALVSNLEARGWGTEWAFGVDEFRLHLINKTQSGSDKYNFFENDNGERVATPLMYEKVKKGFQDMCDDLAWTLRVPCSLKIYGYDFTLVDELHTSAPDSWFYEE